LAILGAAHAYKHRGRHIITSAIEHKAVINSCAALEREGFTVTYLKPHSQGVITREQLQQALRPDTILVSIMHVNNEIGSIQPIQELGALCRQNRVLFHVDAAQSVGKIAVDVANVDLMAFSAHKVYGPKGIGALYVSAKPKVRLQPLMHGGGQERGLRSGTLATHQIVAMGQAFVLAQQYLPQESRRLLQLTKYFTKALAKIPQLYFNNDLSQQAPGYINFSVAGVDGLALFYALQDLAISTGSACTMATTEPSHVLKALGVSDVLAFSSLRITLGRFTTAEEVDQAVAGVAAAIKWLRQMAPSQYE
jgi:cysteine desulfurase